MQEPWLLPSNIGIIGGHCYVNFPKPDFLEDITGQCHGVPESDGMVYCYINMPKNL